MTSPSSRAIAYGCFAPSGRFCHSYGAMFGTPSGDAEDLPYLFRWQTAGVSAAHQLKAR